MRNPILLFLCAFMLSACGQTYQQTRILAKQWISESSGLNIRGEIETIPWGECGSCVENAPDHVHMFRLVNDDTDECETWEVSVHSQGQNDLTAVFDQEATLFQESSACDVKKLLLDLYECQGQL